MRVWCVIDGAHPRREPFWDGNNRLYVFTSRSDAERLWREDMGEFGDWKVVPMTLRPATRKR